MTDRLPEGKSLGWMQAPPTWISSHTVRFIGLVRVVIQDGEGFILIKRGKPVIHYFRQGTRELKGHSALDFFNSHPILEFNLCKYTAEEFALAMKLCTIEEPGQEISKEPDIFGPAITEQNLPSLHEPVPVPAPVREREMSDNLIVSPEVQTFEESALVPQPAALDEPDLQIITQIKNLNGIVAISVFNDRRNLIMIGDADSEPLLTIARNMLATAKKITPLLNWGSFVHLTLQIPEGNMIIAPYYENYICLLTTRTINIGHIRRILRDLQRREASQHAP